MLDGPTGAARYSRQPRRRELPGYMGKRTGWDSNPRHGVLAPCARMTAGCLRPLSHLSLPRFSVRPASAYSAGAGRSVSGYLPPDRSGLNRKNEKGPKPIRMGRGPRRTTTKPSRARARLFSVLISPSSRLTALVVQFNLYFYSNGICNGEKGTLPGSRGVCWGHPMSDLSRVASGCSCRCLGAATAERDET